MGEIKMQDLPGIGTDFEKETRKNKVIKMSDVEDYGSRVEKGFMKIINKRLTDVFVQGQWKGQRCFIIAGGPSVSKFDLKALEGENTIGINMAFRLFNPSIIYGMDARLWGWIENEETGKGDKALFDKCQAIKVWSDVTQAPLPEDIVLAPCIGRPGLSKSLSDGLGAGTNSGFGALNLALLLGASEIYLIGYDFKGGRWHPGYPMPGGVGNDYHLQCYLENSAEFKEFDSKIINLNPESKLKIFEFGIMPVNLRKANAAPQKPLTVKRELPVKKTDPVFVNYFTAGNGYDAFAKDLKASMERFEIEHDIQAIKDRGKWDINTKFKPEFILKMMDKYPSRPIVWVDADAVFVKFPELLYNIKEDVAVHYYKGGKELVSNLVYFAQNDRSRKVLEKWKVACEDKEREAEWDQIMLQKILSSLKSVKVNKLPPEYCYILLGKNPEGIDPVVEQRQASRKLKK